MRIRSGGRQILMHGMALVLAGLVWGLVVPLAPYPRLALAAHIQLEMNGLLFIILGLLLLTLPHRVGPWSILAMQLTAWATWLMALCEAANGWWGTSQTLPIAAAQAGATGGASWQEAAMKLSHLVAAFGLIASWTLLIVGFVKRPPATSALDPQNAARG